MIGTKIYLFSKSFRWVLGHTQPSVNWYLGSFPGMNHQGVKLATDVLLVLVVLWSCTSTSPVGLHDVGIATCYGLDSLGIESQCGHKIFCSS